MCDQETKDILSPLLVRRGDKYVDVNLKPSIPKTLYRIEAKFTEIGLDIDDIVTLLKRYCPYSRTIIRDVLTRLKEIENKLIEAEEKKSS